MSMPMGVIHVEYQYWPQYLLIYTYRHIFLTNILEKYHSEFNISSQLNKIHHLILIDIITPLRYDIIAVTHKYTYVLIF